MIKRGLLILFFICIFSAFVLAGDVIFQEGSLDVSENATVIGNVSANWFKGKIDYTDIQNNVLNCNASGTCASGGVAYMNYPNSGNLNISGNFSISDDGYIGSVSDKDAIKIENDGEIILSQDLSVTNGVCYLGVDDTISGQLFLRGHDTGSNAGGQTYYYTAKDHDTNISYYQIISWEDDFHIGPNMDNDFIKIIGASAVENLKLQIAGDTNIDGDINSSGNLNVSGQGYFGGDVGIGTASPDFDLDVDGSAKIANTLHGTYSNITFDASVTGWTLTSPLISVDAAKPWMGIILPSNTASTGFVISQSDLVNVFTVYGDKKVVVDGNVGIGTSSPGDKLKVVGNGNFTGDLAYGGSLISYSPLKFGKDNELGYTSFCVWDELGYQNLIYWSDGIMKVEKNSIYCDKSLLESDRKKELEKGNESTQEIIDSLTNEITVLKIELCKLKNYSWC